MRNKKNILLLALFLVIGVLVFVFAGGNGSNKKSLKTTLYFLSADGYTIVPQRAEFEADTSDELYRKMGEALIKGPSDGKALPIMNRSVKLNSVNNNNGSLTVDFSEEYAEESITTTYAVIKTYSGIVGVNEVKVTVNGKGVLNSDKAEMGFLRGDEINTESDDDTATGIRLYFANETKDALASEYRTVNITDTQPVEQYIVNELIKGPNYKGNVRLLAQDTGVLSAETTDGTCYVNFKQDFIDKNMASQEMVRLTVYSVVNSLTERENVKNVQFLIDGKKTEKFGDMNIGELFVRNEMMIEK